MKTLYALVLAVACTTAAAKGSHGGHLGGGAGTGMPQCFLAGQTALHAVDARNHGVSRDDARHGEFIPSAFQMGGAPVWVVQMIDPYLTAAYAAPAPVDSKAVGDKVMAECKARLAALDLE
jgi:hypothetical protein